MNIGDSVKLNTNPEDSPETILRLFVYGTLKRGQANYPLLAPYARAVLPATARGLLCDLGLFPALVDAPGVVRGELIRIEPAAMPAALAIIDALEGYDPADPAGSMYVRRVVAVRLGDGSAGEAYAYFYNRDPAGLTPVPSGEWAGPSADAATAAGEELAAFSDHVRGFLGRARPDGNEAS